MGTQELMMIKRTRRRRRNGHAIIISAVRRCRSAVAQSESLRPSKGGAAPGMGFRKRRSGWLETPNPVIATLAERSDGNLKRNVYARYGSPGAQTPAIQALPGYPTACNTCPPRSWNLNVIRYQQLFIAPTSASWFH